MSRAAPSFTRNFYKPSKSATNVERDTIKVLVTGVEVMCFYLSNKLQPNFIVSVRETPSYEAIFFRISCYSIKTIVEGLEKRHRPLGKLSTKHDWDKYYIYFYIFSHSWPIYHTHYQVKDENKM